jgi:hypothetical protein
VSTTTASDTTTVVVDDDEHYSSTLHELRGVIVRRVTTERPRVFMTDASPDVMWAAYLGAMPHELRQHHNCHACRAFIKRYGGLVMIDQDGDQHSLLDRVGAGHYQDGLGRVARVAERAKIVRVFGSADGTWGTPETGARPNGEPWRHLAMDVPRGLVVPKATQTAGQWAAERTHESELLARSLRTFDAAIFRKAHALLTGDHLSRSELAEQVAGWMLGLRTRLDDVKHERRRENLVWLAAASAPAGWCHAVSSGLLGTLLTDIELAMPLERIAARWAEKVRPDRHLRPTAPPSAGQVDVAERIVKTLGLERSLERRFARLDEIVALWTPPPARPDVDAAGGVFAAVRAASSPSPKPAEDLGTAVKRMTVATFLAEVVPTADAIEVMLRDRDNFTAYVTAVHADAEPLLYWDRPDQRNPVSWYVVTDGSTPGRWGLRAHTWALVTALSLSPSEWYGGNPSSKYAERLTFMLAGARDSGDTRGAMFFPAQLRSELHGVRATLAAHANLHRIADAEDVTDAPHGRRQLASGLTFEGSWEGHRPLRLRVTSGGFRKEIELGLWR